MKDNGMGRTHSAKEMEDAYKVVKKLEETDYFGG
jgi:hypothetical protein